MTPRARNSFFAAAALVVFAAVSYLAFRGYMTPEMMVYFLSFQWCF